MEPKKLIIENRSDMPMEAVVRRCLAVIEKGRISTTGGRKHYCGVTTFASGYVALGYINKTSDRIVFINDTPVKQ